ncbi:MAG: carbohydrate ABC transporter permease [Paracoccaceae bacterium]|nr:carbohydrate ABC transporter permease [Paracoccaceae bacterium]MDE2675637.1 carbohydrate ABC transporter permease [Paracoccaceae bacterium]MYG11065.1 carbohydrate ABC transporter permease [Paracoccaceae bacterium]MYJ88166.1 carbohydrate ABC transporter permease [Paracoccaceae bacterium]
MSVPKALQMPIGLKVTTVGFITFWCVIAAFPIFWIAVMSFKEPLDSFASNPLSVIFGPSTRESGKGLSVFDIIIGLSFIYFIYRFAIYHLPKWVSKYSPFNLIVIGWLLGALFVALVVVLVFGVLFPPILAFVNGFTGFLGTPIIGFTTEHYLSVWAENEFYRNFINSIIVTLGVVTISLSIGTLAGYGLARSGSDIAFWILIGALIFRALPHSVLVSGYLPVFVNSAEYLRPILGDQAPTFYGQPLAVIMVLVAINQPFTIWMLRSFFQNIPKELDESARVDGCTHFKAFRWVIMPIMWPGVITTGLFSFLLAYNDFLVTSLLLDAQNQTMVPAIAGYFNRETTTTDQVEAVAAAVSITAPLFLLVMVFQRQIVSGLTAGAVKG